MSGDLFIYYEEGNPRARVAPDVFVAFGVSSHKRPSYKLWEEGVVPAFVMEVASVSTWREDDGRKAKLYERLGVPEYWQYDPTGEYLGLRLKGRRLVEGAYVPQPVVESIDGTLLLRSETLELDFRVKGEESHFFDPGRESAFSAIKTKLAAREAAESRIAAAESRSPLRSPESRPPSRGPTPPSRAQRPPRPSSPRSGLASPAKPLLSQAAACSRSCRMRSCAKSYPACRRIQKSALLMPTRSSASAILGDIPICP